MDDAFWQSIRRAIETIQAGDAQRMDLASKVVDGPTATIYSVGGSTLIRIDLKYKEPRE